MKSSVVLLSIISAADAFSSGASVGEDLPQGHPMQACDAIGVCALGCPTGMTAVAPPTRSLAYSVTGPEEGYTPGELVEVHVSVHQRLLRNKLQAGQADGEMVSAKYIGLLLYAVATGDATETKLGVWEQPAEKPPRFWSPPDPGCDGRALMHADPRAKRYDERFLFRAPALGDGGFAGGNLTIRALLKHGDTNMGAFYWPGEGEPPAPGVAGGDLVLGERAAAAADGVTAATEWLQAAADESCDEACARASPATPGGALSCDATALGDARSWHQESLEQAVGASVSCALPALTTCAPHAPATSGADDASLCFYPAQGCAPSTCDAKPLGSLASRRLCPLYRSSSHMT